ncbi:hypothetical protein ZWY2020_018468 [Hordeum vulgare]|nr:hypothetical protein ZWY2020_018468 [Hordeum vulgare]
MQGMNKSPNELFMALKVAESELRKEHQVLMVNKTTSFKRNGKGKKGNSRRAASLANPSRNPKLDLSPETECYYRKGMGHRNAIAPSIRDKKAAKENQSAPVTMLQPPVGNPGADYVVLSPKTDNNVDAIPTPPIASEADTRFSKRNTCGMQEKVEDRARRLASKKDLEGLQQENDAGELRSGAELVRTNTMQLMKLCEAGDRGRMNALFFDDLWEITS